MGLSLLELCLILLSFCFKPSIQKSLLYSVHTHSIFPIFKIGLHPGFPAGSDGKESACNPGDLGSIAGSRRAPGEGNGNSLQYSCLENSMDGGAWWATVHGVAKSWTRISDFTFTFFHIAPNIAEYSFLEISLTVRLFLSILLTIPFSLAIKYLLYLQPIFLLNSRPIYL